MRILQQDQVDIDENVLRRSSAKLVVTSVDMGKEQNRAVRSTSSGGLANAATTWAAV